MTKKGYRKTRKLSQYAGTDQGVHEWYRMVFERLGYMVIAKAKGWNTKIAEYKRSITHLIKTIEQLKTEYEDRNRVHDMNVLLMNVKVLKTHVDKDFR
jgi:hypothetical protein